MVSAHQDDSALPAQVCCRKTPLKDYILGYISGFSLLLFPLFKTFRHRQVRAVINQKYLFKDHCLRYNNGRDQLLRHLVSPA